MLTGYAENQTRERVRLKAARSEREAAKLQSYLAERRKALAKLAAVDIQEQTRPFNWAETRPFDWDRCEFEDGAGI